MSQAAAPAVNINKSIVKGGAGLQVRYVKDTLARWVVWVGGLGVIAALLLIFVYLLLEVLPLFSGAQLHARPAYALPGDSTQTLYVGAEEQGEVGIRVSASGEAVFFDLHSGQVADRKPLAEGVSAVTSVVSVSGERAELAAQTAQGQLLVFAHRYAITYPNDKRLITPQLEYPFGPAPLPFMDQAATSLAVREESGTLLMAGADAAGSIHLKSFEKQESLLGDSSIEAGAQTEFKPPVQPDILLMEPMLGWLYAIEREKGRIAFYKLNGSQEPKLVNVYETGAPVQAAQYLGGGISIIVAQANGLITQWFPARDAQGEHYLARVREFELPADVKVTALGAELRRRSFAVGDASGQVHLFHATSGRHLYSGPLLEGAVQRLAFNPRANYLMALGEGGALAGYDVHNEHPEISWNALWGKVWYESYDRPEWLWQSSSASADFEAKFSMTPLSVGTLKGAFYAMIFAIPLAILGAIFTAYFMSPEMRQVVKPSVEVLAALPSVILGFLAGLWLAPFVETNLPGMFLVLLFLPLSIPVFGYLWMRMPRVVRYAVPPGWEAALLLPVIALVTWLCFLAAKPLEILLFGGNMQAWMDATLGIGYDQRNALVVGIAMGIAVIPVIFSIAEDAIFTVPQHLTLGSLALGATAWQTLVRVVLPTASPGIFSAVMIGMGRAVGETMIVLMATGNTPVTDFSLFQGMRTLAANVAVEMPESEVGSTHFRMLFLAGLVLFMFTFLLNTVAEVVRSRLRARYSNL